MKSIFLYLIAICVVSRAAYADTPPQSLVGYGKTQWGMTPEEVIIAEAPRAQWLQEQGKSANGLGLVSIKSLKIAFGEFDAIFVFDASNQGLKQVIVNGLERKNPGINMDIYARVEGLLTEKYGPPTYKDEGNHVTSWILGKTKIVLAHLFIPGIVTSITISYEPVLRTKENSKDL